MAPVCLHSCRAEIASRGGGEAARQSPCSGMVHSDKRRPDPSSSAGTGNKASGKITGWQNSKIETSKRQKQTSGTSLLRTDASAAALIACLPAIERCARKAPLTLLSPFPSMSHHVTRRAGGCCLFKRWLQQHVMILLIRPSARGFPSIRSSVDTISCL